MKNLIIGSALLALVHTGLTLTPAALAAQEHAHNEHEQGSRHKEKDAHDHAGQNEAGTGHSEEEHGHDEQGHDGQHEEKDDHAHGADDEHKEEEHGHDEESVSLNAEQAALANIQTALLTPRTMDYRVYAPGEIKANGYTSYFVSPRVESVVIRRHAALDEHVKCRTLGRRIRQPCCSRYART
ncbi:MAG: hypothetical protein ACE5FQ_10730, partial [Thiogranum sp.]